MPTALILGCALAWSLPAYLLTNESFRPQSARVRFEGRQGASTFDLPAREPLFLEYEAAVHAPDGDRPTVDLQLNGVTIATVGDEALYRTAFERRSLPLEAVRAGRNQLTAVLIGLPGASFDISARIHNYTGIAPDVPRAVVVSDESLERFLSGQSPTRRALRLAAFYLGAVVLLGAVAWLGGTWAAAGGYALLWSPALMLAVPLGYSLMTPSHLWLWPETLAALVLVAGLLTRAALWLGAHGPLALRVAVAAGLTFGLLEGALRGANAVSPMFIFYSDSFGRYRGQPGAPHFDTHLNSRGFNDEERGPARPPGVDHRVIAIGDSFAFGVVPYAGNYLTLAERALARDARVELVKMGVAGTEPRDYLAILVEEALPFNPDLVMVGFYVGNDFESRARKLYEHSHVATLGHFLWNMGRAARTVAVAGGDDAAVYDDDAATFPPDRFLQIQVERSPIYTGSDEWLAGETTRAVGYLRQMRDLTRDAGAGFLVVLIPDEVQVDAGLQAQVARLLGRPRDSIDFARPASAMTQALAGEGIRVLDLLPVFAEQARHGRLYKPQDTHWNLAGNRLAAETITPVLREMLRPAAGQ